MKSTDGKVSLFRCQYGKWKNPQTNLCEVVEKFTWKTANRLEVSLMTFGASLIEIKAPDRDGACEDILMGYERLEDYLADGKFNFGATIGPVSGIIKNGEFCLKGKYHRVGRNLSSKHCVDGGSRGLGRVNWSPFVDGTDVILSHATDGSNGFPGILLIQVKFSVQSNNTLVIKTTARSNRVTPVDISHRFFFNLSSHCAGVVGLLDHLVKINSSKKCERSSEGIFKKTPTDLTSDDLDLKTLSKDGPVDSLFLIDNAGDEQQFVMRVVHPPSGRVLEVHSNQPTIHFSTCPEFPQNDLIEESENEFEMEEEKKSDDDDSIKHLTLEYLRTKLTDKEIEFFKCRADTDSIKLRARESQSEDKLMTDCQHIEVKDEAMNNEPVKGKDNSIYYKNSGFSISCQNFPNAVNHQRTHPNILLKPGQVYENLTTLKFEIHVLRKPTKATQIGLNFPIKNRNEDKFPVEDFSDHMDKFF